MALCTPLTRLGLSGIRGSILGLHWLRIWHVEGCNTVWSDAVAGQRCCQSSSQSEGECSGYARIGGRPTLFRDFCLLSTAPGPVDTPHFAKESAADAHTKYREAEAAVALRNPVSNEAVARTCLFLASERWEWRYHCLSNPLGLRKIRPSISATRMTSL